MKKPQNPQPPTPPPPSVESTENDSEVEYAPVNVSLDVAEVKKDLDVQIKQTQKDIYQYPSIKNKLSRLQELKKILDEKKKYNEQYIEQKKKELDEDHAHKVDDFVKSHTKTYNFLEIRGKTDTKRILGKLKHAFNKTKALLINMELANGDHTTFTAYPDKESFVWEKKTYVVIAEYKYYNHDAQLFCLDYHENFTLPIKRSIPIDMIRKSVEGSGITDIENATNPSTLKRFIESEIIEKVMKGQALEDALTMLKFLGIATVIGVYLHLVIYVIKSGMLSSIRL